MVSTASLFEASLRLRDPVLAADRVHDLRTSLFLSVRDGDAVGVGEVPVSSGGAPDATALDVVTALDARVHGARSASAGGRTAGALVEAAHLDLSLRREGRSLAAWLGVTAVAVGFAGVVGVTEPESAAARALSLVEHGAGRLRVKHAPGQGTAAVRAVLDAVDVPVAVDANGALDAVRDRDALDALCELPIAWLEQPFAASDLAAHAALRARTGVVVALDEAVVDLAVVAEIARLGAASVLCVKPSRVGGVAATRAVRRAAAEVGIATYVGGYFEAGLGRAVLGALAAEELGGAPVLVGDVVGPATYLVDDPCALAPPADGRQPLHLDAGCGPHPAPGSLRLLRRYEGWPSDGEHRPK